MSAKNSWCEHIVEQTHYTGMYWGEVQKLIKEKRLCKILNIF